MRETWHVLLALYLCVLQCQCLPFLFPEAKTTVVPDPSVFFSPKLLSSPLPTNSFFQNFVLKNGDQFEYIHPYLIQSSLSTLSLCYPSQSSNSTSFSQVFNPDLTISAANNTSPSSRHVVSSFSDLGLTLDLPSAKLRFFLVRGSPYLTCLTTTKVPILISTSHAIIEFTSNTFNTKYTIRLNNNQTWLLYSSSPVILSHDISSITTCGGGFSGIIRIAMLPESDSSFESILDHFRTSYPVSGDAVFSHSFSLEYKWKKKGWGGLLMLAHPLHLQLLSGNGITVLNGFKYKSIDGDLVGIVGDSWSLKSDPVSVTWHSIGGVKEESRPEIVKALVKDVKGLNAANISTTSSYFYAKLIARAARLALIADELRYRSSIPAIRKFLKATIESWLDGTFKANGFLYEKKWGGIVTKQGSLDPEADFGFGIYNDHHFHLGYFLYGIAVLAKIDPAWGKKYKPQAYSLMTDYMTLEKRSNSSYTQLRNFDLWKLHSWAAGLYEYPNGRNQESTSEAVNGYYSAALMGLAYGDTDLFSIGSTLASFEIHSAKKWWHVKEGDTLYPTDFTKENRLVGVLMSNKRDSALWFAASEQKEFRLGIQLLPILPISEVLFSDTEFVKQVVEWTLPSLARKGVGEGWKGFLYALEGIYDRDGALSKIRKLKGHDDGNSLTNLLWWIHSRGNED